jgi:hypothetical protein
MGVGNGSSGHAGGTRSGQTHNKHMDQSACDREEGGCGEVWNVYDVIA